MVELLAVIVILGIVASIATFGISNLIEAKKAGVCDSTRLELKNHYERHLSLHNVDHSQVIFDEFFRENMDGVICPEDGLIVYEEGDVECSIHSDHEDSDEEEEVPFL
ncbi:type II secretion system protein [Chryseomicrobium palamuruense]|uniref:Type II secretion system protein n=1 Tax=Chryseomicrobium palamuruense TaxID=682973 RepID=A0ABV8UUM2_9BACL